MSRTGLPYWIYFLVLLWPYPFYGQEVLERANGEKIILYPDGTWAPFTGERGAVPMEPNSAEPEKKTEAPGFGGAGTAPAPMLARKGTYATYSTEEDVMLTPPTPPCAFAFSGPDPSHGKARKDLRPALLFSYTDPGLEAHFPKRDLVQGSIQLTSFSAGRQVLHLEVAVASRQAPQLFGSFQTNDFIRFTLLDGREVKLISHKGDTGKWDEVRQAYIYRAQYPLGAKEFKWLEKSELDKVLVRWSKVKEEYQVFDVDVLARQFACLLNG